jgi:hypothetical protein
MANLIDQVGAARESFRLAGLQAAQTTRDLFSRFGYTMAGADGSYTTGAAAEAWDPERLRLGTGGGAYMEGSTGELADIRRAGSEEEALATQGALQAGLGGSGLAAQRARLAESKTASGVEASNKEFERMLGSIGAGHLESFNLMERDIRTAERDEAERQAEQYAQSPTPEQRVFGYGKPGGKKVPKYGKKDKGKMYQDPGGVNWKWDGKGWKKQLGGRA